MQLKNAFLLFIVSFISVTIQAQKTYALKLNLPVDAKYDVNLDMGSTVGTPMGDFKLNMTAASLYDIKDAGVNKNIEMTYQSMVMNVDGMGKQLTIDSKDSSANDLNKSIKSIIGKKINILVDSNGNVIEVKGFDSLSSDQLIKTMINSEALKSTMAQAFNIFPHQPVAIGQTWQTSVELSSPYKMTTVNNYTLTKVENGKAFIAINGTLSSNGSQVTEMQGMKLNMEINGTSVGSTVCDMATGMFEIADIQQNMKGKVNVSGNSVDLDIKSVIKMNATKK